MAASSRYAWDPITVPPDASVVEAADAMDAHGVGCVVVVDDDEKPTGILTDRDLCCRVVAAGLDADRVRVSDVMTASPAVASKDAVVGDLLETMQRLGVRRIPLVEDGRVVGVVSFDDVVLTLATQLWNVSEGIREELREGWRTVSKRRRREAREDLIEELRDRFSSASGELRARAARDLRGLAENLESLGGGRKD